MKITLLSAALLASGIACAATPVDGWYTNVFGGYTYLPDNLNNYILGYFVDHAAFSGGYNVGGRLGYKSNPMRYELEYTFTQANVKSFRANYIELHRVSGHSVANIGMANIYYDTPEMLPGISPYLGLGIGYAYIQDTIRHLPPFDNINFSATDSSFAYQGMVGLTYDFSENYAVNIGYRYVATTSSINIGTSFQAHMASAGATYRFDYGYYK